MKRARLVFVLLAVAMLSLLIANTAFAQGVEPVVDEDFVRAIAPEVLGIAIFPVLWALVEALRIIGMFGVTQFGWNITEGFYGIVAMVMATMLFGILQWANFTGNLAATAGILNDAWIVLESIVTILTAVLTSGLFAAGLKYLKLPIVGRSIT